MKKITPDPLYIKETIVNQTGGCIIYTSDRATKSNTHDILVLFRDLQKEYGRCRSKIYKDNNDGEYQTGWVFEKKMQYSDCDEHYIQETWISVYTAPDTVKVTEHPYSFKP